MRYLSIGLFVNIAPYMINLDRTCSAFSGAQDDLKKVTQMAYLQIKNLGMSDVIGHLSFPSEGEGEFVKKPYSKKLANMMDQVCVCLK